MYIYIYIYIYYSKYKISSNYYEINNKTNNSSSNE